MCQRVNFFATELDDFSSVCSEIQNLKAREVVVGYDLPEADEQVLVKQTQPSTL